MVAHGHVLLNGRKCNIPSLLVKSGDRVGVKNNPRSVQMAKLAPQANPSMPPIPDYLSRNDGEPPEGTVVRLPTRGDVDPRIQDIREQLIIEVCSR